MISCLDFALEYQKQNLSVIPIRPKEKKPLIIWEEFQQRRATELEIRAWWKRWPQANVGIVTGSISGIVVIDLDNIEAGEMLKQKFSEYDFSSVPRQSTGKGNHLFFKHPGSLITNRAGVLPGMDVRGDGGYVVAAPSIHPSGRLYAWKVELNGHVALLPQDLYSLITSVSASEPARFDTANALNGVPQGQRDETIFRLACKLRNADVPFDMACQLVTEASQNCQPPFSAMVAREKVIRAYRKYEEGKDSSQRVQQQDFWPDSLSAKDFLEQTPDDPDRWIWEDCLPRGASSMLAAKPKVGKSTLAAALAMAISRGHPFLNRGVQRSGTLYVYLDGPQIEIKDIFGKFGINDNDRIRIFSSQAIPPVPQAAVNWLIQQIDKFHLDFVVIDPIQKFFQFKELKYEVIYPAMSPVQEMLDKKRAHVFYLHHAGKGEKDDLDSFIGSQAFRAITFSMLHMKKLSPDSRQRILRSSQRAGRDFDEVPISDGSDGCMELIGTLEDAWIRDKEPLVRAFVGECPGCSEKEILDGVQGGAFILKKTIRSMRARDKLERTGKGGQHGRAEIFRYYLPGDLIGKGEKVVDLFGKKS